MPSDKFESDARRMATRAFGGYLVDRALGRVDFAKDATTPAPASTPSEDIWTRTRKKRENEAGLNDGTSDPTRVEYGGHRGSSVRGEQ